MNKTALTAILATLAFVLPLALCSAAERQRPEPGETEPAAPPAIEIRQTRPRATSLAVAMRGWYATYRRELMPVRRSLAPVLAEIARGRTRDLAPPCRRLRATLAAIDLEAVLPVPDFAADLHLKRALGGLYQAATACVVHRTGEMIHHLDRAGAALGNAALALRRYGLEP